MPKTEDRGFPLAVLADFALKGAYLCKSKLLGCPMDGGVENCPFPEEVRCSPSIGNWLDYMINKQQEKHHAQN